ncbi:sugar ABC transporter permease [Thermosipho ferrireducens]|uniref:Sugar ABC transporter permease n=1 Tax=Thermosipho ferrireducens TaxID=2571116 RepID=A0ABX7S948_9BACT|nr:sugar ABC transporter permease [Thermosipho ferrireducens]QTA38207.1 sugar ABC transporter permease [Thermosipho ferrireducens]
MASRLKKREGIIGWGFSATYLIYAAIFWGYPFVWLVILSFTRWRFFGTPKPVGFGNFVRLFSDPIFWRIFLNTVNFMIYFIPMVLIFSFLFALALSRVRLFRTFFALSFLIANVSSGVAYSILFSNLFSESGPLNNFLYKWIGKTIPWFSDPQLALLSIAIMVTWKFVGYYGLILFAGLNAIPKSLYEAADLDGATNWTKFWKITLPLINPALTTVLVFAVNLTFGIFTEPYMITGGGPMRRTLTFMMHIYTTAFQRMNPSYAASLAVITGLLSYGCVMLVRWLVEKEVNIV